MGKKKKEVERKAIETEASPEVVELTVEEVMRRDEEELDQHLRKFVSLQQKEPLEVEEEEDDEEETITLDFKEEGVVAYEKVAEGFLERTEEGIGLVDEETSRYLKEMLENQAPKKHENELRLASMIQDRLVSHALKVLVEQLRDAAEAAEKAAEGQLKGTDFGSGFAAQSIRHFDDKKDELRRAWRYDGKVDYAKIPDWAMSSIEGYLANGIVEMLKFTERD